MGYQNQLHNIFGNVNPLLVHLIENMLKFNPSQRLTAKDCLTNTIFDEIRDPAKELEIEVKDIECIDKFQTKKEAKKYFIKLMEWVK